jgi:cytochrome c-type biogenesis protein CcmF
VINEIGHLALALGLSMALLQSVSGFIGAHRGDLRLMVVSRRAAFLQFLFLALAFAGLTRAFVVSDFSLAVVAENSHSLKPMIYKVAGVWGNHEGSILLWVLILALFGMAVAYFGKGLPATLQARVLGVQALIGLGFLAFILATSDPFLRLSPVPLDGRDLNPLLQDIGLAIHPPMLYLGYVGFSMAFAFAVAALLEGRVDAAWGRWVRPWTLVAWIFLTGGITLGSWWAYYELGWGGWWFWDPVENVSFMPWLTGTALLHSTIVVEKREALRSWTILLAIMTFSLSLIGTFIVRSGLLTSVHAFAVDPERGAFILVLLALAIGGSLILYAWRAPDLKGGGLFAPVSREGGLLLNNLFLATAAGTVFIGTLYPLFIEVVNNSKISIGPPFFNQTFVPLMMPLVFMMGLGPLLPWKRADLMLLLPRLKLVIVMTCFLMALVLWKDATQWQPLLGIGLAGWVASSTLVELARRIGVAPGSFLPSIARVKALPGAVYGMSLAHLGLAVAMVGMFGASYWTEEFLGVMKPGDSQQLAGYEFKLEGLEAVRGSNYQAHRAVVQVRKSGEAFVTLMPEQRFYPVRNQNTTEAAIKTTLWGDLYVTLGEIRDGELVLRLAFRSMIVWLWGGVVLMVLGGLCSLFDRRLRIAIPARKPAVVEEAE